MQRGEHAFVSLVVPLSNVGFTDPWGLLSVQPTSASSTPRERRLGPPAAPLDPVGIWNFMSSKYSVQNFDISTCYKMR